MAVNGAEAGQRDHERRVTPLELFFDLVFGFNITQVTGFLWRDPTGSGLLLCRSLFVAHTAEPRES